MLSAEHLDPMMLRFPFFTAADKKRIRAQSKKKSHVFKQSHGDDCILEDGDKPGYYFLTAQRSGVGLGDTISFKDIEGEYEVLTIAYYSDPSDLWLGVLRRVNEADRPT